MRNQAIRAALCAVATLLALSCLAAVSHPNIVLWKSREQHPSSKNAKSAEDTWQIHDTANPIGGSSKWLFKDGVIHQRSNIYNGDSRDRNYQTERYGSLLSYSKGKAFRDGTLSLDISSSDDDGVGVAFRFEDDQHHYLWTMDKQRNFHVIALKNGEEYEVLGYKKSGYDKNRWYQVRIEMQGNRFSVFVDDQLDFEIEDGTFAEGTVALYTWGSTGAKYRNIQWNSKALDAQNENNSVEPASTTRTTVKPSSPDVVRDDWPMYRADAARSGYTASHLPARLSVGWIRKATQAPSPAWSGRDTRMPFDRAFQPVISKGLVVWGSSADCTVRALDAETGSEKWRFFTDAPVRFAPAIWNDRVFIVSDDGYLYCLDIAGGGLLWKKRGGPDDDLVLGHDRLVSRWPARGGPVVKDGVVYFGAGIWPAEGIYLYATDATTGRELWVNDSSGGLVLQQPHAGNRAKSGVSIQGYLTIAGDSLIVPTGRATPAIFDRESGQFKEFHLMRGKAAGPFVTAIDDMYFIAEDHVFESGSGQLTAQGLPVGSTAVSPDLLVFSRGSKINAIRKSSFPGEMHRNPRRGRATGRIEWSISCSDPVGASVTRATVSNYAENFPEATQTANPPLIVAGTTIVAGTLNNKVVAADITSKEVVTTAELDGLAIAAAG